MRPATIAGLVLLVIGGFIAFRGLSYTADKSVISVGEFQASVEERRSVPIWVGVVAGAAGLALLFAGSRQRG
jgi:hypothetical protein